VITLIAKWTIKQGCEAKAISALKVLAEKVVKEERTLIYLCHTPDLSRYECRNNDDIESLPTPSAQEVIFFEQYADEKAFCDHINSKTFQDFVKRHGKLFLASNGKPFVLIQFLNKEAGFIRKEAAAPQI
jgi:uncharacterized protein